MSHVNYRRTTWRERSPRRTPIQRTRTRNRVRRVSRCIGCGCTDDHACYGGCWWHVVCRAIGRGVCSRCVVPRVIERYRQAVDDAYYRAVNAQVAEEKSARARAARKAVRRA